MNYNTLNIEDIAKDLNITLEEAKEYINNLKKINRLNKIIN